MVATVSTKPFNPLLGETFEFQNDEIESISEQVSHHPPVTANFCRGKKEKFTITHTSTAKSKFRGTYMDFQDVFKTYVELPELNERYELFAPVVSAHNIIIGKLYIDIGGTASTRIIGNNNLKSEVRYTKKGWFTKEEYKFVGDVS